ncbi:hypothetical protein BZG73_09980 [Salinivibrio siamensis]|uniref:Uncharacterized protein n=1 Tax=Salinivibrio siamensis TaxID=414286 RepID=A0ABX3K8B2_9GAMM|nr:hypothetical protein [Salinivibrio siamensis]OOE84587.1 hypothetical protein BZG73_09980 [Salinivibrio siamensis]
MTTELVTQLIILATALVGLYKAATFRPAKTEESPSSEGGTTRSGGSITEILEPMIGFVGYFGFMLAFPAFIWAFSWITSNMPSPSDRQDEVVFSIPYEVSDTPSKAELMFIAANSISYSSSKGEALEAVVAYALKNNNEKIAILAASSIPYSSRSREQLEKIVKHIATDTTEPNKSMQPTANEASD